MRKKLFLVSSLIGLMVITAFGQKQNKKNMNPERMAKHQTEMIKEATGIDAATTAKVDAINLKYAKEMAALRKKTTDRKAMREPMKALNEKKDAELKKVLTDDQFKKYQTAQEEMRKKMRNGGGGQRN